MKYDFFNYLSRTELWIVGSALVAFLVVTWVLRARRRARAGEAEGDDDAPRAGYRDRIVVAVVVGLILILGGAYVALSRGILWSLPIFAVGFGLVLALIAFNRRYRHASPSLRRTIDFSSAFLNASLLAGILIVVNVIAFRYGGQPLDLTREQTYSLSSMTINQLVSLEQPVTFTMVFGRGIRAVKPARPRRAVARVVQGRQSADDPARQPQPVQRPAARRRADQARAGARDLARRRRRHRVRRGGKRPACRGAQPGPVSGHSARSGARRPEPFASAFTGEDEITSALIRLREGKKSKVAFTTGHGEPSTSDLNPRGRGIGNWKARLTKVGCEVIDLNLIQDEIPSDLSLLIVVGPKGPFKPDELAKLKGFTIAGGPVLLLLGNTEPSRAR